MEPPKGTAVREIDTAFPLPLTSHRIVPYIEVE